MGNKPTIKGFELDDSFFDEYEGGPRRKVKKHMQVKIMKQITPQVNKEAADDS